MSLDHISAQMNAQADAEHAAVDKWRVFQNIREAREKLGATDRSLAILNALLSFYPETELSSLDGLVVWPSNEQLSARSNGMSPATLRRHLAVLVEAGLIIRRDSPNGKRFARKSRDGQVSQAYGFDLSPILARADLFARLADEVRNDRRALQVARERVTLLRRDIVKSLETAIQEDVPGDWGRAQHRYSEIMAGLPRKANREVAEQIGDQLEDFYLELRQALETFIKSLNLSANESQNERHIKNSNPDSHKEFEDCSGKDFEEKPDAATTSDSESPPKRDLSLGMVLEACPGLTDLSRGESIDNWRDVLAAAQLARPLLGITPSAWAEALAILGPRDAAVTMAAIYQKGDAIKSAGGYLRSLVERAKNNKFSTWPMVLALLRANLDAEEHPVTPKPEEPSASRTRASMVSPSLISSLARSR